MKPEVCELSRLSRLFVIERSNLQSRIGIASAKFVASETLLGCGGT